MKSYWLGKISEGFARDDVVTGPGREIETNRERPSCEIHNPDFSTGVDAEGRPRKPTGLCSVCVAELAQKRRHTGSETEVEPDPRRTAVFGSDAHRVDAALDAYNERQRSRVGYVVPGSPEESRALEIITDRREDDRDSERRRSGRVLFTHIEDGCLVDYVERRLGGRKYLARVGP